MIDLIKALLDRLSSKIPPPEMQEADRMNIKHDNKKLDEALERLKEKHNDFADVVKDVVEGVRRERSERRKNAKVH